MTPMEGCYASAEALLRDAARRLGFAPPDTVPLRLQGGSGLLRSALPRRLAAQNGGDAQALAEALRDALALNDTPFDRASAEDGMLLLSLSDRWFAAVLSGFAQRDWPEKPPMPPERNEKNPAFLLAYTARRCRALAEREQGAVPDRLPAGLLCLLAAEGDAAEIARAYWQLPPEVRAYPPLAKAVGVAVGSWQG